MYSRTERVLGVGAVNKLKKSRVLVFGIGGVGGHAVEALARAGVGTIGIVDKDTIEASNINRQLVATTQTIGRLKTEVMAERIHDINPGIIVKEYPLFYLADTADKIDFTEYDYVIDAVDNVTAKILIIVKCDTLGIPVISSMGTGNKLDPTAFEVEDIYKTTVCPLAKVMRRELKERGIGKLKVVYSKETPIGDKERTPGSVSFVPPVAGMILAGEVIKDLTDEERKQV